MFTFMFMPGIHANWQLAAPAAQNSLQPVQAVHESNKMCRMTCVLTTAAACPFISAGLKLLCLWRLPTSLEGRGPRGEDTLW